MKRDGLLGFYRGKPSFQWLEKAIKKFPMIGKLLQKVSNDWKKSAGLFQWLEMVPGGVFWRVLAVALVMPVCLQAEMVITPTNLPYGVEKRSYSASFQVAGGFAPYVWRAPSTPEYVLSTSAVSTFAQSGVRQEGWLGFDESWQLELPFEFAFYGQMYTQCWVNSNGELNFVEADNSSSTAGYEDKVCIGVFWMDLRCDGIFVDTNAADAITIRWQASPSASIDRPQHMSATLKADGSAVLAYGDYGGFPGFVCVSDGSGTNFSGFAANNMGNHPDLVFTPELLLPDWLTLSSSGLLSGTPPSAGTNQFSVIVSDASEASVRREMELVIKRLPDSTGALLLLVGDGGD